MTKPGDFLWFDLLTNDVPAAIAFYEHVIGWTSKPMGGGSPYVTFATADGQNSGTMPIPEDAKKMGMPPCWVGNVHVANVDDTIANAKKLGGRVLGDAQNIPNIGRFAVLADPHGSAIQVFEPTMTMNDRDITKQGEFTWCELLSAEHETAFVFYSKLFGWKKTRDFDMGAMGKYLVYNNGGRDLGGMMTKPKEMPVSAWMYYVEVKGLDAAIERAKSKGGRVLNGPMEVPGGARIVQLADPQGAMISLHEIKTG